MPYRVRESRVDDKKPRWIRGTLYTVVIAIFCFWAFPVLFGLSEPPSPMNFDLVTPEDVRLCEEAKGYEEGTYRYRRCLRERIAYNECKAKNTARYTHYNRDAETVCASEAKRRFKESALADKTLYDKWPGPRPLGAKPKSYSYSQEDIAGLQNVFTTLCAQEWVTQRELLPSVLPDCEHILEFSRVE